MSLHLTKNKTLWILLNIIVAYLTQKQIEETFMIDFSTSTISQLSVHEVGNKNNGEQLYPSAEPLLLNNEDLVEAFNLYFLKPFQAPIFYEFTSSTDNAELNPIFQFTSEMFKHPSAFHINSINIAKHLFEATQHPNIKAGDLYISHIEHCLLDGEIKDAIGIFKCEQKNPFIMSERKGKHYKVGIERGIDIDKLDKGCLVFNTNKEKGYKVCTIDKTSKGSDAQFWKNDFLNLQACADSYHFTNNFLSVTKAFVTTQLDQEFDINRTDQIDLLNKSVNYFKENERFNEQEFTQSIFGDAKVIDSFNKFKEEMIHDADLELSGNFNISTNAVKKQARVFKSVLKLDKNFHIYIHGNRELIERGEDEQGRKFYKIYFNEEA